jgi:hypothetical protein
MLNRTIQQHQLDASLTACGLGVSPMEGHGHDTEACYSPHSRDGGMEPVVVMVVVVVPAKRATATSYRRAYRALVWPDW